MNSRRSFLGSLLAAALTPALRFLPAPGKVEPSAVLSERDELILSHKEKMLRLEYETRQAWIRFQTCPVVFVDPDCTDDDLQHLELHQSEFGSYYQTTKPNKEG